jgi:hypothetical protein
VADGPWLTDRNEEDIPAMPENTKPPQSRRVQARVFRVANVPMRFILGLPVPTPLGCSLMRAFIVGRKSGGTYRQPLSYVRDRDTLLTPERRRSSPPLVTRAVAGRLRW